MSDPTKPDSDMARSIAERPEHETKLQLFAEELSVAKQTLETGRVRIATRTHEREAVVEENLEHQRVEIETIPVGRRIDAMPDVRQEGDTTIIPIVEEFLIVERRLLLKEELRITRIRTTEPHQEKVTLRHQEAVITRAGTDDAEKIATDAGPIRERR